MSAPHNGYDVLRSEPALVASAVAAVAVIVGLGWAFAEAGVATMGASGPAYRERAMLLSFNVHILAGLALAFALLTQLSARFRATYPRVWLAGAVMNGLLMLVSISTGYVLSTPHPALAARVGLYWSVGLLSVIWCFMAAYFWSGQWFHYRLWAVRSGIGLVLQVPFRFFLAGTFAVTGDEELAAVVGYWSALILSFALVEWVLLPLVWRPERNVKHKTFEPDTVIVEQGDPGRFMYVINRGTVEVTRQAPGKPAQHLSTLGEGQWFGEMALVDDLPCNATVTSITTVDVTVMDRDGFNKLFGSLEPLRVAILSQMRRTRESEPSPCNAVSSSSTPLLGGPPWKN